MSKYSSTFLKSLNDEPLLEAKEGSKKKLLLGKSEMTEKKMTPAEKKERNKIFKGLDKKAVVKKYGKDIRGAIATKKAMELKENSEPYSDLNSSYHIFPYLKVVHNWKNKDEFTEWLYKEIDIEPGIDIDSKVENWTHAQIVAYYFDEYCYANRDDYYDFYEDPYDEDEVDSEAYEDTLKLLKNYYKKFKQWKKVQDTYKKGTQATNEEWDMTGLEEAAGDEAQGDETAWKASLDKGTNPDDFKVADNPQLAIDKTGIHAAHEWIKRLEDMAHFVNGTGPESLNSQINLLELKNSVPFRGVVRREEKRITKLAESLRGLAEVFKSVVITSEKKIKDASER